MTAAWQPTGEVVQVSGQIDRIPPFDHRAGDHLWVVLVAYRVNPDRWDSSHPPLLDLETLLTLQGPACYYCERPYSVLLSHRRCKGRP